LNNNFFTVGLQYVNRTENFKETYCDFHGAELVGRSLERKWFTPRQQERYNAAAKRFSLDLF
jgi:hypothetical protein